MLVLSIVIVVSSNVVHIENIVGPNIVTSAMTLDPVIDYANTVLNDSASIGVIDDSKDGNVDSVSKNNELNVVSIDPSIFVAFTDVLS